MEYGISGQWRDYWTEFDSNLPINDINLLLILKY